jgi:hypothetical protein
MYKGRSIFPRRVVIIILGPKENITNKHVFLEEKKIELDGTKILTEKNDFIDLFD